MARFQRFSVRRRKWEWLDSNVSQLEGKWERLRMARFQRFSVICKW